GSPLPAGATLESWTTSVTERIPARFSFGSCASSQGPVTVGGDAGTLTTYDCAPVADATVLWIIVLHGGEGWHLVWTDVPNVAPATIRPKFDAFLATFAFGSAPLATSSALPSVPATSEAPAASLTPALPSGLYGAWYH